jgi:hypothetical protein
VRRLLAAAMFCAAAGAVIFAPGCSLQQAALAPEPGPQIVQTPAHPLPFRLSPVQGDSRELPPAVAMSLAPGARFTFAYREELAHGEDHTPLYLSAFNPATYAGYPLGKYTVTADASLSIFDGNRPLGDYHAAATVSESYSLYAEPTHRELEDAARAAVREKIDRQLYADADRLARAATNPNTPQTPALPPPPSQAPEPAQSLSLPE